MAPSDHDLMERIREQDASAFEQLFGRYHELILRRLAQIVRDDAVAHDLLQEVFVRVWTHADRWDERGPFKAWLFRVATNRAISYLRSPRHRNEQSLDGALDTRAGEEGLAAPWMIAPAVSGPEFLALVAERRATMRRLVDRLPDDRRTVFRMVHEAEMDVSEVAETLGIPEGTVKSRLHYARKWLARAWNDLETEQEDDR